MILQVKTMFLLFFLANAGMFKGAIIKLGGVTVKPQLRTGLMMTAKSLVDLVGQIDGFSKTEWKSMLMK